MKNETTKQRILTEAVKLFSKEGYEAVSVDQIAKAVGIKAPSLYKHYKISLTASYGSWNSGMEKMRPPVLCRKERPRLCRKPMNNRP